MTTNLLRQVVAVLGLASAVSLTSCYYDPYYGGQSSYGYGGGGYSSTSVFVSTGDPRWGYDPYCHSYYDYHRRAYYDPYRYGYYPVGYRPAIVYGVPHPHGWRPGYCPPPSRVRGIVLSDYRNRGDAYRRLNYSWSRNVQQRESGRSWNPPSQRDGDRGRPDFRPGQGNDRGGQNGRPNTPVINRPQNPSWNNGQGWDGRSRDGNSSNFPGRTSGQPRYNPQGNGPSQGGSYQGQPRYNPGSGSGQTIQPRRSSGGGGNSGYQPQRSSGGGGSNFQPQRGGSGGGSQPQRSGGGSYQPQRSGGGEQRGGDGKSERSGNFRKDSI